MRSDHVYQSEIMQLFLRREHFRRASSDPS